MNVLQQTLKMYKAFLHHGPVFLKNQISRDTSAQRFYQTRLTYYAIYLYVMPSAEAPPYIYKELYSACWCDLVKVVWAKDSQNSLLCACDDDTLTDCERLNVLTSCQADYPAVCGDGRDLPTYADELWEREIESRVDSLGNASQTILPLLKFKKVLYIETAPSYYLSLDISFSRSSYLTRSSSSHAGAFARSIISPLRYRPTSTKPFSLS